MKSGTPRLGPDERGIVVLRPEELTDLIAAAELLREEETHVAGRIRILRVDDRILVQEQVPETQDLLVRGLPSRQAADRFVEDRLADYERMWDGCGCKIDYFQWSTTSTDGKNGR